MLDSENNDIIPSRLYWACRRGMLELDILLSNFLSERYKELNIEQQELFASLLTCQDPDLFAWIMGHAEPPTPDLLMITTAIRNHAQSRF